MKSYRILRLGQFLNIYSHLKQQQETLKMFNNEEQLSSASSSHCFNDYDENNPRLYDS